MPGIIKRIINIAKAKAGDTIGKFRSMSEAGGDGVSPDDEERYQAGKKYHEKGQYSSEYGQNFRHGENFSKKTTRSAYPEQVIEDLKAFGLEPPSSLNEVKKARNREIMKYHSDRFMNDPEKLEISRQIMQILNLAYERLEKWYTR
jgi:curved DNA-binding protein CbpA